MRVRMSPLGPSNHRFVVDRPRHDRVEAVLETRSLLLHDLAHYAVESTLETPHGFYGLLAMGAHPRDLRDHRLAPEAWERLMALEFQVVQLQTAFKRGLTERSGIPGAAPGPDAAWLALRALHEVWARAERGQALELTWPPGPPRLVTACAAHPTGPGVPLPPAPTPLVR